MELFLKAFSTQLSTTPFTQVGEILEADITLDITGTSNATVEIPDYVTGLSQFNFIELVDVGASDKVVFRWFIINIQPRLWKVILELKGEKEILKYKLCTADATFTAQAIGNILSNIFGTWNTAFSDSLSYQTSSTYAPTTKSVKLWDNFYSIIDELASGANCVWDSRYGKVYIEPLLWVDYTSGITKELIYDKNDPSQSNIYELSPEIFANSASIVFGVDGTYRSFQSDAPSMASYGKIAEIIQVRKTNQDGLDTEVATALQKKKNPQWSYWIKVDPSQFEANVWDKVLLTISWFNSYVDVAGTGIINGKNLKLKNSFWEVEYIVSDKYVIRQDFLTRFKGIESNLALRILQ